MRLAKSPVQASRRAQRVLAGLAHTLQAFAAMLILSALGVLALDALEYESTGSCNACVLLPHLSARFDNQGSAEEQYARQQ